MISKTMNDDMRLGIREDRLASIAFSISWESAEMIHTERHFAQRVNLWRDILPPGMRRALMGKRAGESVRITYDRGELLYPKRDRKQLQISRTRFGSQDLSAAPLEPKYGRFYPQGVLRGVPGVFRGNINPFRCTEVSAGTVGVDLNHPLAGRKLSIQADIRSVRPKFEEHGGTVNNWTEMISGGAGMQSRINGKPTDFFHGEAFGRADETDDRLFYEKPRLVHHLDELAEETISRAYRRLIRPGSRVLDLMSSWISHLPADLPLSHVTGLGLNAKELEQNPQLHEYRVHDLNQSPQLPFDDGVFDAVICTASVEYLNQPAAVFAEAARVLSPDGVFIVSFSNRWFPPKTIQLWTELHEFERMGLVSEYFFSTRRFCKMGTMSSQGWPRPQNDKYFPEIMFSDPVFIVWGHRDSEPESTAIHR